MPNDRSSHDDPTPRGGGLAIVIAYFVLLFRQCIVGELTDMQKAAVVGIIVISIHSAVDYPLRALGLGVVFALLSAVTFSKHSKNAKADVEPG